MTECIETTLKEHYVIVYEVSLCCNVHAVHRIFDTFEDYFTECTETTLKEHYVIVYEVSLMRLRTTSQNVQKPLSRNITLLCTR